MAKTPKALGAIEVKRLADTKEKGFKPGFFLVGTVKGLYLNVKETGASSWILRRKVGASRKEMGLGSYPETALARAIEKARAALQVIEAGQNPIADKAQRKVQAQWTFETCANEYIETHRAGWKNLKHGNQWASTLTTYAFPFFGSKNVQDVDTKDVLAAIRPNWATKNETMGRVRNRIELVLSWAAAQGYREKGFNPAAWRGHLDQVLPKPSKVAKPVPFKALPFASMYDFMQTLSAMDGMGARCLEFVILCACRSGEARGALWSEIDMVEGVWSIPAARMKAGRPHRIPLSDQALTMLDMLPRFLDEDGQPLDLVFPGMNGLKPLSDMTLSAVMRRLKLDAVPHGFRSTFTDWVAERTHYTSEVREMALAHVIGNETEASYRRGDLFEKRRNLMADWAAFVSTPPVKSPKVVRFKAA